MKYRRNILDEVSGEALKLICKEISERYEIEFIEIDYESDHVHFFHTKCSFFIIESNC